MNLQSLQSRTSWFVFICLMGFMGCDGAVNDPVPEVPSLVFPQNGAEHETSATELQWNSASSASYYHVQISNTSDFASLVIEDEQVQANSFPMSNLEVGKLYYWRIRGINDVGFGDWTEVWSFTTEKEGVIPPMPTLSFPRNGELDQPTQVNFGWDAVEGATTYHIQVSLEQNFVRRSADVEGVRGTSAVIRGLVPTYIYYWRVRSQNPLGFSDWSASRFIVIEDDL